jgi:WD40 repeat protein
MQTFDWRPDGQQLVMGSDWGDVTIWNARDETKAVQVLPHGSSVSVTAYAPDGRMLLTASDQGEARIWDLSGREERVPPKGRDEDRFNTTIWELQSIFTVSAALIARNSLGYNLLSVNGSR